jgi:hypothetical protein
MRVRREREGKHTRLPITHTIHACTQKKTRPARSDGTETHGPPTWHAAFLFVVEAGRHSHTPKERKRHRSPTPPLTVLSIPARPQKKEGVGGARPLRRRDERRHGARLQAPPTRDRARERRPGVLAAGRAPCAPSCIPHPHHLLAPFFCLLPPPIPTTPDTVSAKQKHA